MILQLRHTSFITQSLKAVHSGRETGLIDTGPFQVATCSQNVCPSRLVLSKQTVQTLMIYRI